MLALEGIKVLDLTWQGPGPYCTMILGDLGAGVVRIGPPSAAGARQVDRKLDEKSVAFQAVNRNKSSILLNLKTEKGKAIFYRLVEKADVLVEAFRPSVTQRLGIDYPSLRKINHKIVYCSISGYGQDGPYRDLPGHDINYISMAGVLDAIGEAARAPAIPLNLIADYGAGAKDAVIGIITSILARDKTGKGQHIDISLTDSVISLLTDSILDYYFESGEGIRRGTHPLNGGFPYYNVYETKDGKFISLGCIEPWLWERFCRVIGKEDFIPFCFKLEHYLHVPEDKEWGEILSYLRRLFLTRTRDEWFDFLSQNDISVGKVRSLDEVFADKQVLARRMVIEVEHPDGSKPRQVGIAIKLSDTPGTVRSLPPLPGQHTESILSELGYSPDVIEELRRQGIIE